MGKARVEQVGGMRAQSARALVLFAATALVIGVGAALLAFGVDRTEVMATLLFIPVFAAALLGGRTAGWVVAVVASVIYVASRLPDLEAAGGPSITLLALTRVAAYGVAAEVGVRAQALVESLSGDDDWDDSPLVARGRAQSRRQRPRRRADQQPTTIWESIETWPSDEISWEPPAQHLPEPAYQPDLRPVAPPGPLAEPPTEPWQVPEPVYARAGAGAAPAAHDAGAWGAPPFEPAARHRSDPYGTPVSPPPRQHDREHQPGAWYGAPAPFGATGAPMPPGAGFGGPLSGPAAPPPRHSALPPVDPETKLSTAQFLCDCIATQKAECDQTGRSFSLVLVQVPDEPLAELPYRRQVTLLRELGHQFVAGHIVDHLVHVPDQNRHWFAVVLPDTDRASAELLERRLRMGIGGYLRSRGLPLADLESASLTAPDDDPALGEIWDALSNRGDPTGEHRVVHGAYY
jgi:hypothetical protein